MCRLISADGQSSWRYGFATDSVVRGAPLGPWPA
jgi:hypothetical protein